MAKCCKLKQARLLDGCAPNICVRLADVADVWPMCGRCGRCGRCVAHVADVADVWPMWPMWPMCPSRSSGMPPSSPPPRAPPTACHQCWRRTWRRPPCPSVNGETGTPNDGTKQYMLQTLPPSYFLHLLHHLHHVLFEDFHTFLHLNFSDALLFSFLFIEFLYLLLGHIGNSPKFTTRWRHWP